LGGGILVCGGLQTRPPRRGTDVALPGWNLGAEIGGFVGRTLVVIDTECSLCDRCRPETRATTSRPSLPVVDAVVVAVA